MSTAIDDLFSALDFEPGRIDAPLELARRDQHWCGVDIVGGRPIIDRNTQAQWLRLIYKDGMTLDIPLTPKPTLFQRGLSEADAAFPPFFRRHKRTRRLVPFQTTLAIFKQIVIPLMSFEEAVKAIPPRFDANLTPIILHWFTIVEDEQILGPTFGLATQAFATLAEAAGLTDISTGALKKLGAEAAGAAAVAGGLAAAALQEIRDAVLEHGITWAAVTYIARSGASFYLRNAFQVNIIAITGSELFLSLAGQDTGISPGDELTLVVQAEKSGYRSIKVSVESVEETARVAKVRVSQIGTATAEEVEQLRGAGTLVHSERAPAKLEAAPKPKPTATKTTSAATQDKKVAAKAVDNRATDPGAKTISDNGIVPAPQGKRPVKVAPSRPASIHHVELLSEADLKKLEALGVEPEALKKLQTIEIGELQRMGIDPKEITNLYRSISQSQARGGVVVEFINEFHVAPGFQGVVLNWARGGNARPGSNFAMKYALEKFKNQKIRFEWPVGYAVTRTGAEGTMAARYVDVVVDGGTTIRPGEAMRIELKSWTSWFLSKSPAAARKSIARQLVRDTALFGKENIKWVFDSTKLKENQVIQLFIDTIKEDPLLKLQWQGTDDEISAALKKLIEMYP